MKWYVDRFIAPEAPIHIDDLLVCNIEAFCYQGDLVRMKVAAFQCCDLALRRAQLEEKLPLARGGPDFHQRPRTQNVIVYRSSDPPHRVSRKTKGRVPLKAAQCPHPAAIPFRDEFGNWQTIAAVAHRDFDCEPQVTCDEL